MSEVKLPMGWTSATLNDVAVWSSGGTPSRANPGFYLGSIPWFKTGELGPRILTEAEEHISEEALSSSSAKLFPSGSVAVAMYGATIGKASILGIEAATNQACAVAVPDAVSSEYLYYFLLSQTQGFIDAGKGGAQPNISLGIVKGWPLLVPPREEQNRIVAKVEELLTDLEAGIAELSAAHKKNNQYRKSLLQSGINGSLSRDWRTQNPGIETGSELLRRILIESRVCWEAKQLEKFQKQSKTPPRDWKNKYPEPISPDTNSLPELPRGWVWATLSQIGYLDRGRSKHRPRNAPHLYGGPYPFVQTGDIRHADTYITTVDASYSEAGLAQSRLWPKGTICITIAANIGQTAILAIEACFPDSVVGFLPVNSEVSTSFVEYFMRTVQQKLEDEAPATAQKNINLEILERVCIPLPPYREQQQIVALLSGALTASNDQEQTIRISLKQAAAQRQNILKAAFFGQLVPQDPNDEQASVLLAHIRVDREMREKQPKQRKSKAKKEIVSVAKKLIEVLKEADDWLTTQEAFLLCGVANGARTEDIEALYAELRELDKSQQLTVEPVIDEHGRKIYDRLKIVAAA